MLRLLGVAFVGLVGVKGFMWYNRKKRIEYILEKAKELAISKKEIYDADVLEKTISAMKNTDLDIVFTRTLLLVDFATKYVNNAIDTRPSDAVLKALQDSFEAFVSMIQRNNLESDIFTPLYGK